MFEMTLKQVLDLSGVYDDDSDLVKDMKLRAWIDNRKYRVLSSSDDVEQTRLQAIDDAVEILIIKDE